MSVDVLRYAHALGFSLDVEGLGAHSSVHWRRRVGDYAETSFSLSERSTSATKGPLDVSSTSDILCLCYCECDLLFWIWDPANISLVLREGDFGVIDAVIESDDHTVQCSGDYLLCRVRVAVRSIERFCRNEHFHLGIWIGELCAFLVGTGVESNPGCTNLLLFILWFLRWRLQFHLGRLD